MKIKQLTIEKLRVRDEIKEEMIPAFINDCIQNLTEIVNHKK